MSNGISRRNVLSGSLSAAMGAGALGLTGAVAQAAESCPVCDALKASFKDGQYTLPPIPYAYDALEPHIDAATMQLHHSKHHQAYVDGLNKTLKALADLRAAGGEINTTLLSGLQEDLAFHGSGHLLHSVFWATMAPKAGGEPTGAIAAAINKSFGSFAAFKAHFSKAAVSVRGSGWAVLAWHRVGDALMILQLRQHDLQALPQYVPLLPLDVWEHAYYLKYQNARAKYVEAWWNVVNWSAVNAAYQNNRRLWGLE